MRSLAEREGELLASYPADIAAVSDLTEYRTTWIVASQDLVRAAGLFDRYCAALSRIDRERGLGAEEAVLSVVANNWLPIAVARAHYDACDAVGLSEDQVLEASKSADGGQVRRAWMAQIIAAAQKPDAAPWLLLPQIAKWWPRTANGGGAAVYRIGNNEARIDYFGCELCAVPFYRHSARAVQLIFLGHFCKEPSVNVVNVSAKGLSLQLRWR